MKLLTNEELAEMLRISPGTLRNRISAGEPMPPAIKIGQRWLYPSADLEQWLEDRKNIVEIDKRNSLWKKR